MSIKIPDECYSILAKNIKCDLSNIQKDIEKEVSGFFYEIQKDYEPPFLAVESANFIGIDKVLIDPYLKKGQGRLIPYYDENDKTAFKIIVDGEDDDSEKRFTVVHETSHRLSEYDLEGHKLINFKHELVFEDSSNYLARIILMPAWDFKKKVRELDYNIKGLSELYVCPKYTVEARIAELKNYQINY
ncbi:MAG: ImmA/IrrE family metallo-endopeptidase [Candidatus Aenigmarchaeota archaeon]|nr:ImmA/IrrE family metallo-endopeptidase [Candidatus Aenigmarchaeota archaeon]